MRTKVSLSASAWVRRLLLSTVVAALVCAQTVGLIHRVEHRTADGWILASIAHQEHAFHGHDGAAGHAPPETQHDCAATDALALGSGLPAAALLLPSIAPDATARFSAALALVASASREPYQARAPPSRFS